jgi:hypothetical protein
MTPPSSSPRFVSFLDDRMSSDDDNDRQQKGGDGRAPEDVPIIPPEQLPPVPRMTEAQCARLGLMTEEDATLILNAPAPPAAYGNGVDSDARYDHNQEGSFPAWHQWLSVIAPDTLIPRHDKDDIEQKETVTIPSPKYKPRNALEAELLENVEINKLIADKKITDDEIDAILAKRVLAYERSKAGMQLTKRHGNPLFSVDKRWADTSAEDVSPPFARTHDFPLALIFTVFVLLRFHRLN